MIAVELWEISLVLVLAASSFSTHISAFCAEFVKFVFFSSLFYPIDENAVATVCAVPCVKRTH